MPPGSEAAPDSSRDRRSPALTAAPASSPAMRIAAVLGVTVPPLSDTRQLREPLASLATRLDQKTAHPQHKDLGKATCVEPRAAATPHSALMPPKLPPTHGHRHPGPDSAKGSLSAQFGMEVGAKGMGGDAALAGHIKQRPVPGGGGGSLPGLCTGDTNESFSIAFN